MKNITIGIPAFRAQKTIIQTISSILIQSEVDDIAIIIANDDPKENGTYDFLKKQCPSLDITLLNCDINGGPGVARQRCLDKCKTDWITFIDADDVFINPFAIENLKNNITPNCVMVQSPFLQEVIQGKLSVLEKQQIFQNGGTVPPRVLGRNDITHPWVFGRLYNAKFLKENGIGFSNLRAMEDGELNWKIRMLIEGSALRINIADEPVYLWKTGSEHSITRIGIEENEGEPLYNWDLCQVGATAASINAIKFCKKKNPFNGSITRFTVEMMVGQYFTYIQCAQKKPLFAEQNFFNAKRFYNECYRFIEKEITDEILTQIYTTQNAIHSEELIGIIPHITFFEFMNKIKEEPYNGKEEFNQIRAKLPDWVIELDLKSGVLGEEGYIEVIDEIGGK